MILIGYHKSWLVFLEIWSKFKKFDLRQLYESIYSGTEEYIQLKSCFLEMWRKVEPIYSLRSVLSDANTSIPYTKNNLVQLCLYLVEPLSIACSKGRRSRPMELQINYSCTHAWSGKSEKRCVTAAYHLIGAHVMVLRQIKRNGGSSCLACIFNICCQN